MNYYVIEAIWKPHASRISPATSVKFEGVAAVDSEGARKIFESLVKSNNWKIILVRQQ